MYFRVLSINSFPYLEAHIRKRVDEYSQRGKFVTGKHVISTVGFKITKITPSRAFTIELGTATAVLCASFLKLPVSSTHCFIGSVVAVGVSMSAG